MCQNIPGYLLKSLFDFGFLFTLWAFYLSYIHLPYNLNLKPPLTTNPSTGAYMSLKTGLFTEPVKMVSNRLCLVLVKFSKLIKMEKCSHSFSPMSPMIQ